MSSADTFALLVPCKDGARFLERLFRSARAQSRPFDEILLFDDGSRDNSGQVARDFGAKVFRADQSIGASAARNRLAQATACTWLHFHDADDELAPAYVECVAEKARPGVDVVVCDMVWIREKDGAVENRWTYDEAQLNARPTPYLICNTIGGINGLYRRTTFERVGGFAATLGFWEDMDLNIRLARSGSRFAVVNQDLVIAYRRDDSLSNTNLVAAWRSKLETMDRLRSGGDEDLLRTIAAEAEVIGDRLLTLGAVDALPEALAVAARAGGNPPTTHHPLLKALKPFLPRTWSFRLQSTLRRQLTR